MIFEKTRRAKQQLSVNHSEEYNQPVRTNWSWCSWKKELTHKALKTVLTASSKGQVETEKIFKNLNQMFKDENYIIWNEKYTKTQGKLDLR